MEKLQKLYDYPIVGDIRGKGLMIGIELVRDQKTKTPFEPAVNLKNRVTETALDKGLVLYPGGGSVDGIRGDHFLLAPPLIISDDEVDILIERLESSIQQTMDSVSDLR
jgi:adenosylmethionine-8-amino-7-oxononanoate aminotransferase